MLVKWHYANRPEYPEATVAEKTKVKQLRAPKPPDSFTRSELLKAIKKVAAARRCPLRASVRNGAN